MNEIQSRILTIFEQIKNICDENHIPYYAIGGTCIGAVRHKGFIPWDDDMDIAIPIEEWDRFWDCMEKNLPPHLGIYNGDKVRHYRYIFWKIHDRDTTFIEEAEVDYPDAYKGIYVDVMPIAGIPIEKEKKKKFCKKIYRLGVLNYVRRYPFHEMENVKRKLMWMIMWIFRFGIPFNYYSQKWMKLLRKYPLYQSELTGYTWHNRISDNLCFPFAFFRNTEEKQFENTSIACPGDWDGYLSRQFGDYLTLPPLDKRQDHHQVFVSTQLPYSEYKGERK